MYRGVEIILIFEVSFNVGRKSSLFYGSFFERKNFWKMITVTLSLIDKVLLTHFWLIYNLSAE